MQQADHWQSSPLTRAPITTMLYSYMDDQKVDVVDIWWMNNCLYFMIIAVYHEPNRHQYIGLDVIDSRKWIKFGENDKLMEEWHFHIHVSQAPTKNTHNSIFFWCSYSWKLPVSWSEESSMYWYRHTQYIMCGLITCGWNTAIWFARKIPGAVWDYFKS